MQKSNTCKYITIKDLIIFQLPMTAVLKVLSEHSWRVPLTFSESLGGKNYFIKNPNRLFAFSFSSHEYMVEFSRGCMTCNDVIPLKAVECVLLYFSVLNISALFSNKILSLTQAVWSPPKTYKRIKGRRELGKF